MATYRTIRMDFWNDPYVEGMEPQDKLLYVYLFSSPHTNNLGVLTVSRRKIAFETGLTEEGVAAGLAALERDGKVLIDGGAIWVCNFVRHQCTTSPKLLLSLRALFPTVPSCVIRRAICDRYPHIFAPADTVSVPTGESEKKQEREKEDQIGTDGFFVPVDMLEALQRDFPDVDVQAEITRIRDWQSEKRTPIRQCLALPACMAFQCEDGETSSSQTGSARIRCGLSVPRGILPAVSGSPCRELRSRPRMVPPHSQP